MISGTVTPDREAVVRLGIYGPADALLEVDAFVDTGYNGQLTLPPAVIAELNLAFRQRGSAILADGSDVEFDVYDAVIEWDGTVRRIIVDAAESDPLLGMRLLDGYELIIQAVPGGAVSIAALG